MSSDLSFIYITCPDMSTAEEIASTLVEEELIACANMIPNMVSVYKWEGRVETTEEVSLILKTQSDLFVTIEERIRDLHPYECPCVVELPIQDGSSEFLQWIREQTNAKSQESGLYAKLQT